MSYLPETQEPKADEQSAKGDLNPAVDRFSERNEQLPPSGKEAMGPGEAARKFVGSTLGLEEAAKSPTDLGSMWDRAAKIGDFSQVDAETEKAILEVYESGGIGAVRALHGQIDKNISTKRAGSYFKETKEGIEIHNIQRLSDAEAKQLGDDAYRLEGLGWVRKLGTEPIKTVKLDEKPQAKQGTQADAGLKRTVKLNDDCQVFRAADGATVIYNSGGQHPDSPGELFYSQDGKTFHDVVPKNFKNDDYIFGSSQHTGRFIDPSVSADLEFRISRNQNGDTVTIDDKMFKLDARRTESIESSKLPEVRVADAMFKLPDGKFIYSSSNKYSYPRSRPTPTKPEDILADLHKSPPDQNMYIGTPGNMRKIEIQSRTLFLDGTCHLFTSEGILSSPGINDPDKQSTWTPKGASEGIDLIPQEPGNYQITEGEKGLMVLPKPGHSIEPTKLPNTPNPRRNEFEESKKIEAETGIDLEAIRQALRRAG